MEILELLESTIAEDGQHISLKVETDGGPQTIEINATTLRGLLPQLAGLADRAKESGIVSALQVTRYFARPTDDRKAVLIALTAANKIPYLFALAPTEADTLRRHIGQAVKACA